MLRSSMLVDAFQPEGVTELAVDGIFMMPHLGALLAEHPQWRKAITAPDGHIYYLPGIVDYPGIMTFRFPMLNTAWLRKSGSSVPATTEQLAQVLRSFRDRDMNGNGDPADEIPYSAHTMDYALRAFLGSFGLDYQCRYWISIHEEEPEITLTDPRFRELLRYFNLLYTEKLLDPEILTQNTELYLGKLRDGRIGFTPLYDRLEAGSYAVEWFDVTAGTAQSATSVTVTGGSEGFTPPFSGPGVLLLQGE